MMYTQSALVTIVTTGVPVALATGHTPATDVFITAVTASGTLVVGGVNPVTKVASVSASGDLGIPLIASATLLLPPASVAAPYDLSNIYIDGTAADTVSVTYLLR